MIGDKSMINPSHSGQLVILVSHRVRRTAQTVVLDHTNIITISIHRKWRYFWTPPNSCNDLLKYRKRFGVRFIQVSFSQFVHRAKMPDNLVRGRPPRVFEIEAPGEQAEFAAVSNVEAGESIEENQTVGCNFLVDWRDDSDPDNPLNYSSRKKVRLMAIIAGLAFLMYL